MMIKGVALAAMLVAALVTYPSAAPAQPKPAGSLCRVPEAVLEPLSLWWTSRGKI